MLPESTAQRHTVGRLARRVGVRAALGRARDQAQALFSGRDSDLSPLLKMPPSGICAQPFWLWSPKETGRFNRNFEVPIFR